MNLRSFMRHRFGERIAQIRKVGLFVVTLVGTFSIAETERNANRPENAEGAD
jgi:hypothetical protein